MPMCRIASSRAWAAAQSSTTSGPYRTWTCSVGIPNASRFSGSSRTQLCASGAWSRTSRDQTACRSHPRATESDPILTVVRWSARRRGVATTRHTERASGAAVGPVAASGDPTIARTNRLDGREQRPTRSCRSRGRSDAPAMSVQQQLRASERSGRDHDRARSDAVHRTGGPIPALDAVHPLLCRPR